MLQKSPPESICVIRLSAIGDTCHALAVVRSIQDAWPETRLTWIIGKTEATLMSDIPGIKFIIFDKARGARAYADVRSQLRGERFDVALCMHASMRANLICRLVKTRMRLGYDLRRARDFQWLFTNHRIEGTDRQHVQDAMLEFARHVGVPRRELRWDIPLSHAHREFAAQYESAERPVLVISPCSSERSRNFRNWSAENYAAAANHARQKFNCRVILTGSASATELEYGNTIRKLCDPSLVNLIGKTSLKQLLAILDIATALVCPDSGPAHMATTVRTPVVGLYATSNPERTGPYFSREFTVNAYPDAVRKYLDRSPDEVRWGQRVRDPHAMGLIRLGRVNEKIDLVFARPAAAGRAAAGSLPELSR
jgi:heptosyltransferase I